MIDSLVGALDLARASTLRSELGLAAHGYAVLTLHRPSNVDDREQLRRSFHALLKIAERIPILFPSHPRTAARIADAGIQNLNMWKQGTIPGKGLWMMPPASYLDFLGMVDQAAMVLTDSGGVQEETTYLGVPCLTYRNNTERPVTVTQGTNRLIGSDPERLLEEAFKILDGVSGRQDGKTPVRPPLWDGKTAPRIWAILKDYLQRSIDCPATLLAAS
jgi:UDP-N-acetylglucosamine 2-epimerase (non-hydrolysing)